MLAVLAVAAALLADPNPPLGVANPAVTQATIHQTICQRGWTKTVRPPASFTNALKRAQLPAGADPHAYEEDHVLPIEDGGAPRDPGNLRPQLWVGPDGARAKDDTVETPTRRRICAGEITLVAGQAIIRAWVVAHHPYPVIRP